MTMSVMTVRPYAWPSATVSLKPATTAQHSASSTVLASGMYTWGRAGGSRAEVRQLHGASQQQEVHASRRSEGQTGMCRRGPMLLPWLARGEQRVPYMPLRTFHPALPGPRIASALHRRLPPASAPPAWCPRCG